MILSSPIISQTGAKIMSESKEKVLIKPSLHDKEIIFKMASSAKSFFQMQEKLQALDFNVNMECDKKGDFLLHIAARNELNYFPLLMSLVRTSNADIDLCNTEGMTPLMLAAASGNCVLCDSVTDKALVRASVMRSAAVKTYASHWSGKVLICLLNANPNKPNTLSGRSVLHYAAEGKHRQTVQCLIQRGADLNMEDHDGKRPDDILTSENDDCQEIIVFNRMKRIEMLSDMARQGELVPNQLFPSDFCVVDTHGQTLIMIAAVHNKFECLHSLLQVNKTTLNAQHSNTGMTALAMSSQLGNVEAVKSLLRHKACPIVADMEGYLPLHHAVMNNHDSVVDILLDYFPETYVGLYKAMQMCKKVMIHSKLKSAWEKRQVTIVTPKLYECAISGHAEELFTLLDEGDSIDKKDDTHFWPLYLATENGHLEVLQLLYENGGDISKRHPITGGSLLHVAAQTGHLSIVTYLLQFFKNHLDATHHVAFLGQSSRSDQYQGGLNRSLDINIVDRNNKTALQLAAERGFIQIVDLLLVHGATTSILDSEGGLLTCSHFEGVQIAIETHRMQHTLQILNAVEDRSGKALSTLQKIWLPRFDHHLRNKEGCTPLMVAAKTGKVPVIQFLLESAIYTEETQFRPERNNNIDSDSDADSGVLDLAIGSLPDYNEFQISQERITLSCDGYFHGETRQDGFSTDLQDYIGLTDYSRFHMRRRTSTLSDINRQMDESMYHGGQVSHVRAVNLKDSSNVLHYAIHNSDASHLLALFLEHDPTPLNMQNDTGETVLHQACRLARKKSVQLILARRDVDLNICTFDGHLPEDVASTKVIQKMVEKARSSLQKGCR